MLAYSLVHSGPAPRFLSPLLYEAMIRGTANVIPEINDVYDQTYREQIIKIAQADDIAAYADLEDFIQLAGCAAIATDFARKNELCKCLTHFVVFGRTSQCFDQFCSGLEILGVLEEIRLHGDKLKEMFCYQEYSLSASVVELIFEVQFSQEGSNRRLQEETILTNWQDYLLDVEAGTEPISLSDIFVFATGANIVPPLGFEPQPILRFHDAAPDDAEDRQNFPYANTCANEIELPLLMNYADFKGNINSAMAMIFFTDA